MGGLDRMTAYVRSVPIRVVPIIVDYGWQLKTKKNASSSDLGFSVATRLIVREDGP